MKELCQRMKEKINSVKHILVEFHIDEIYVSYNPEFLHQFLISNNFELVKKFKMLQIQVIKILCFM